jgi:hypothetical protein
VEFDVPVEGDDRIERCPSKQGDKVPAHREEDEDHVDCSSVISRECVRYGLGKGRGRTVKDLGRASCHD